MDTILPEPRACWIAGVPEQGATTLAVTHPYDGSEIADVAVPGREQVDRAVTAAQEAAGELETWAAHRRAAVLTHVATTLRARADELAELITAENGKPITAARAEVAHAAFAVALAAEETYTRAGLLRPIHTGREGRDQLGEFATSRIVAMGSILTVPTSASPLAVVARDVAAALAVGAPTVITPAHRAPLSALLFGEILAEADLPAGAFSILPVEQETTQELLADSRLPVVSFTGSAPAAGHIADAAGRKRLVCERGGGATALVLADWPDLSTAAARIAASGACQAGQSPVAVQNVIVAREVAETFLPRLHDAVHALSTGNPYDETVEVGPLVDDAAAERISGWIEEAVECGASALTGGNHDGTSVEPTLLVDVPPEATVWRTEVFAPVLSVAVADGTDEAFDLSNRLERATGAGVFTRDMHQAWRASSVLDARGVTIGDVPAHRNPQTCTCCPAASGADPTGIVSAMHGFSEHRVTVFRDPAL